MQHLFAALALSFIAATVAAAPAAPAASAAPAAAGTKAAGPALGAVLQEVVERPAGQAGAEPVHSFKPLPPKAYEWDEGTYRSAVSGLTMRLPQVRDEKVVSVREAVVLVRANGDVETSHVMFVPGAEGTSVDRLGPVSAVVVTRLGNGRPTDRETVLRSWEPRTPEQRKQMEAHGIEFHRIRTGSGEGLERIVPNRIADANFPYRTHTEEGAKLQSVGVTRYLVSGERALLEFSQVFPCRELAAAQCKDAALKASDRFVADLAAFTVLTAAKPAAPPASSGK
jgi:hypothetical protein